MRFSLFDSLKALYKFGFLAYSKIFGFFNGGLLQQKQTSQDLHFYWPVKWAVAITVFNVVVVVVSFKLTFLHLAQISLALAVVGVKLRYGRGREAFGAVSGTGVGNVLCFVFTDLNVHRSHIRLIQ